MRLDHGNFDMGCGHPKQGHIPVLKQIPCLWRERERESVLIRYLSEVKNTDLWGFSEPLEYLVWHILLFRENYWLLSLQEFLLFFWKSNLMFFL